MRKTKPTLKKSKKSSKAKIDPEVSLEQALQFVEDMKTLRAQIEEPTIAISVRVPGNVLRAFKMKSKALDKKYQSQIVKLMREWLSEQA